MKNGLQCATGAGAFGLLRAAPLVMLLLWASPARAAYVHFRIDPAASEISAAVAEPLSWIRGDAVGSLRLVSGDAYEDPDADRANQGSIWLEVVIDAASYHSDSTMRDSAVKSSALETQNFPAIFFKGGSSWNDVSRTSDSAGSGTLKGQLTLHGVTRPFEFPVQASLSGGRLVASGEFSFDYTDFGIETPSILGLKAGNAVKVSFHAVATRVAN